MSVKADRYRAEVGEDGPCPPKTRSLRPLSQEEQGKQGAESDAAAPRSCLRKSQTKHTEEGDLQEPVSPGGARKASFNFKEPQADEPEKRPTSSCLRKSQTLEAEHSSCARHASFKEDGEFPTAASSSVKSGLKKTGTQEIDKPKSALRNSTSSVAQEQLPRSALRNSTSSVKSCLRGSTTSKAGDEDHPVTPVKSALRKSKTDFSNSPAQEIVPPSTPSTTSSSPRKKMQEKRNSDEDISVPKAPQRQASGGSISDLSGSEGGEDDDTATKDYKNLTLKEKLKIFAEPVNMAEKRPEFWSVRHICQRAFYKASQEEAWGVRANMSEAQENVRQTGSVMGRRMSSKLGNLAVVLKNLDDGKEPLSPKAGKTWKPKSCPAVFIVDEEEDTSKSFLSDDAFDDAPKDTSFVVPKPPGDTGAPKAEILEKSTKADTGGTPPEQSTQLSPLKELLTAKKVNTAQVKTALQNLSRVELDFWIDAPLEPAQTLPPPLFFAIGATLTEVVGLLLEFSADVKKTYGGPKMYNGWIKPGASPIEAVTARRGRFIGTMLGDRLESILELLRLAEANYEIGAEKKAAEAEKLKEELEKKKEELQKKDAAQKDTKGRKSIKLKGKNREIEHTQGHPRDAYDVMGELGEGHLTSVKEAMHRKTGVRCAIKAQMKIEEGMIWEEVAIIRKLDHPNIIYLYETFEDESNIFVVLELCAGGELFDTLALQGGIAEIVTAQLMQQVADAVRYLHNEKICHRDIQPENLMLKDRGNIKDTCVKLIDFATAKEFGPNIEMKTKICSLYYVAPEILTRKSIAYTEKIDVWSLGVLFFMVLCGAPPFHAENELETLKLVKKGNLKFNPPEIWSSISQSAKDLISKMLVVDAGTRLSAVDVAEHKWLMANMNGKASRANNHLVSVDQLNHLRNFNARNRVQKIVLRIKENRLSNEAIDELRRMFERLDKDGSGEVQLANIRDEIRRVPSVKENMEEIMRVLWSLEGGTGKVMFDKFLVAMVDRHKVVQKDACRAIFDVVDFAASGKVPKEELQAALGLDGAGDNTSFLSDVETVFAVKAEDISRRLNLSDAEEYTFDEFYDLLREQV